MGEKTREALKLQFDKRLRLEFHGARSAHYELIWEIPAKILEKLNYYQVKKRKSRGSKSRTATSQLRKEV